MSLQKTKTENPEFRKRFGHGEILWIIENYFSATCKKNWVIHSPEFSIKGSQLTRWRMFLKPKYMEENYNIQMYLERLEADPFPGEVQVKWIFSYPCGGKEYGKSEGKGVFRKKTTISSWIYDTEQIENKMMSTSCYIFSVRCRVLVYDSENQTYDIPDDMGLKYLSQSMKTLYRTNKNFDILLRIGSDDIRAHRSILCARNKVLRDELEDEDEVIEIAALNMIPKGGASDFIGYLYTANLDYVLRTPSFSVQDLIDYFKIAELQSYYLQDQLTIRTTYAARVFNFKWSVSDVGYIKQDCVTSPTWKIGIMNLTFQMRLYPKGYGEDTEHMSLFGEFVKGSEPNGVYFVCAIQNKRSELCKWKYQAWSKEEGKKIGFEKFVSRDILTDDSYLVWGNLLIMCKIIIPTSYAHSHSVTSSRTCSLVCIDKNRRYERLSTDLLSLFETGEFSDVTIASRIIRFRAHKVILSYRSHVFAKMLTSVKDGGILSITDFPSNILRTVVHYIYSGTLLPQEVGDIKKLYAAADKFCILPLKYTCSEILRDRLDVQNVLEILVLSYKGKDLKLRYAALKFICSNLQQIFTRDEWHAFEDANPALCQELIQYLKRYVYNRRGTLSADFIENFINNFFLK